MTFVLAFDFGSTSIRAALVDPGGTVMHPVSSPAAPLQDTGGAAEVDPASWWHAMLRLADAVADSAGPAFDQVAAIATSAMTRTQVFLDADGNVLRPAMSWQDTRAQSCLPSLLARLPPAHPETALVNTFHPLARLAWLALNEPGISGRLAFVVEPKDFLNFKLTGRIATDPVSSARLLAAATSTSEHPSLTRAAGRAARLPEAIVAPSEIMGQVSHRLPGALARLQGRPVLAMAHDSWASVIGLGAMWAGCAYNLSGTSEVLGVITAASARAEGLLTLDWGGGLSQLGGPGQNGADLLVWFTELVGRGAGTLQDRLAALLEQPRDPQPALFLPYLQGERTPYWDLGLRGAFLGLNRRHGQVDLAYAVLEGAAFYNRVVLQRAEAATGRPASEIRFGGGGAASARWAQVKADVTHRPVVVTNEAEPGLVGAGAVAFAALGVHASLEDAQRAMARPRRRFIPRPDASAAYDGLFAQFEAAERALAPISRALAQATSPPCPD